MLLSRYFRSCAQKLRNFGVHLIPIELRAWRSPFSVRTTDAVVRHCGGAPMPSERLSRKPHRSAVTDATQTLDPAVFGNAGTVLDGYMTPAQLAIQLGCCEKTLARWHAARRGPPRVTLGRRL